MLAIFFPHLFEDVEYLVPPEEPAQHASSRPEDSPIRIVGQSPSALQPIAGPSGPLS